MEEGEEGADGEGDVSACDQPLRLGLCEDGLGLVFDTINLGGSRQNSVSAEEEGGEDSNSSSNSSGRSGLVRRLVEAGPSAFFWGSNSHSNK